MSKLARTGWGFAKKDTKILRHYGTKRVCHPELVSGSKSVEMPKQVRNDSCKKCAFTLSEVLIVLAVLGVVAAMTIPDLVQDYQKKATATAVKKAYSTLNQVITASAAENGPMSDFFAAHPTLDVDTTKEYFDTYWLPYFRVQKVANDNGTFYNSRNPYYWLNGQQSTYGIITSYYWKRVLFSDASGTIYFIDTDGSIFVDINGTKGPNTFGKDIFYFVTDSNGVVSPRGYNYTRDSIQNGCSSSRGGITCAAKIKQDGWEIADDYPW